MGRDYRKMVDKILHVGFNFPMAVDSKRKRNFGKFVPSMPFLIPFLVWSSWHFLCNDGVDFIPESADNGEIIAHDYLPELKYLCQSYWYLDTLFTIQSSCRYMYIYLFAVYNILQFYIFMIICFNTLLLSYPTKLHIYCAGISSTHRAL